MRIRALLVSVLVALGLAFGVPAVAAAHPVNPCAQFLLSQQCEPYLGGIMRRALAERGIFRPAVSDRVLGQIAGDIRRVNDVRPELEHVLVNPDFRIVQFFLAARSF